MNMRTVLVPVGDVRTTSGVWRLCARSLNVLAVDISGARAGCRARSDCVLRAGYLVGKRSPGVTPSAAARFNRALYDGFATPRSMPLTVVQ
jgi:hypothetical protein